MTEHSQAQTQRFSTSIDLQRDSNEVIDARLSSLRTGERCLVLLSGREVGTLKPVGLDTRLPPFIAKAYAVRPAGVPDLARRLAAMEGIPPVHEAVGSEVGYPVTAENLGGVYAPGATVFLHGVKLTLPQFRVGHVDVVLPPVPPEEIDVSRCNLVVDFISVSPREFHRMPLAKVRDGTIAGFVGPGWEEDGTLRQSEDGAVVAVADDDRTMLVVLDGHGRDGALATKVIGEKLRARFVSGSPVAEAVQLAAADLGDEIERSHSKSLPDLRWNGERHLLGACCAAAEIKDGILLSTHIGDSRVTVLRATRKGRYHTVQETRDHSYGNSIEGVEASRPDGRFEGPLGKLTRHIVVMSSYTDRDTVIPEHLEAVRLQPGDLVVIASDGLRYLPPGFFHSMPVVESAEVFLDRCEAALNTAHEGRKGEGRRVDDFSLVVYRYG